MNRTKHTCTITDVFWIVIDLMFDFDISLFMLNMWINIVSGTIIKNLQVVVCIQLVVHIFNYRFNVFKL